ncbi:MAG: carboxypeptidase-like regulatory domain-containing protein [Bryobacteraceae bacterium]|jgi:hypothetical protein
MKPVCFVLFAITAAAQTTAAPDQTGSVTGVVIDAITRVPVRKTIVSANQITRIGGPNQGSPSAITDAGGAFTLTNLPAGRCHLVFQQQNYPQARFGGFSKEVEVKAGENTGPMTVELIPGAAVSGHIVDDDGDPLPTCGVQIHPAKHPEQGVQISGSTPSDENGIYRVFGIAPGKYIVAAECGQQVFQPRPFSAGPAPPPATAYPKQYYPLTTETKSADIVELTAGNEKSGVDFIMRPAAVTQIRGAFSPGGVDWHGIGQILLNRTDRSGLTFGSPVSDKGTFEFQKVFPGSYNLVAVSNGGDENRIGAWQRIEVSDQPLELSLELRHAIELSGKVEIESSGSTTLITPGQIQVMLTTPEPINMQNSQAQVNDDGTFTLKGVMPGPWHVQAYGPTMFLKSAWLGSADVTSAPMDLSGGATAPLRIVVSTNTATIRGSAPPGQQIYAQRPEEQGNRVTQADQNGQYKFEGLSPGKYRLMQMDSGGPMPDEGGQEVTVHEGETAVVDLKPQN